MAEWEIRWDPQKNELLKLHRDLSFEMVVKAIESGEVIDNVEHPRRPNQRILVVKLKEYLCAVPYVMDGGIMFLKTIYPDRTLKDKYGSMK